MANHVQILLQQAIYEILTTDATLMGLVTGVFDNVPDDSIYPYIEIGDISLSDFGTHTSSGFEGSVTIHAWSRKQSAIEVMSIMNRVYQLLHNVDFSITDFPTVSNRCSFNENQLDQDGRTHHGIQTYDVIIGGNNA